MYCFYLISNLRKNPTIVKASTSIYRPIPDRKNRGVWVSLSKAHANPVLWSLVCEYCRENEVPKDE